MASDRKSKQANSIPIRFFDDDDVSYEGVDGDSETDPEPLNSAADEMAPEDPAEAVTAEDSMDRARTTGDLRSPKAGPELAELLATRAELKRIQTELAETKDSLARRSADFDNYRKRIEREKGETQKRIVAEVARKLLPVLDNLARALDAERSVEASESEEFRHFLNGVELINKQLNEVLESLGVEAIPAVGERFNPHVHEAVVTEATNEYEPDTVIQEMARGYRLGDKLVRPAMVKVAAKAANDE